MSLAERSYIMSLAERSYMGRTKAAHPPGKLPPVPMANPNDSPSAHRLWQFILSHPSLHGTVSVTVYADAANARGLAYLVAEEFCQRIIGQIKAE